VGQHHSPACTKSRIDERHDADDRSNRRAKIKLLAKKSIETGEDCDAIPDSMRQYLAQQAMELGRPLSRSFLANPLAFNGGMQLGLDGHSPQKVGMCTFTRMEIELLSDDLCSHSPLDVPLT